MLTFRSLMNGRVSALIHCMYTGRLARRLQVLDGDMIEVDALDVKVKVRLDTPITHRPWVFDRGDMLFYVPDLGGPNGDVGKLCGEGDPITYCDGSKAWVMATAVEAA